MTWMRSRFAPIGSFTAETRVVGVGSLKIPAAEEADGHARPGGGIGLAPLHGVENRLTGIFGGPYSGVAGRRRLPAHDDGLVGLDEGMNRAIGTWFGR